MTLPASGPISIAQANVELGRPATLPASMDEWPLRWLAGAGGSGTAYSMSQFHGKSAIIREPASGDYYDSNTFWQLFGGNGTIRWGGITVASGLPLSTTSHTVDVWTYFRGSLRDTTFSRYSVWRTRIGP